jgi:predicted ATPase/DNA-binding winged helix-turn-helix (wHTH) protein
MPVNGRTEAEPGIAFGRYRLFPRRRLLLAGNDPVELGSRAFEILVALVEAKGDLVAKDELRRRVWPGTVVEEHNIDVQVSALRKALRDDRSYIRTEAGRGYRFVAEVSTVSGRAGERAAPDLSTAAAARSVSRTNLPTAISMLVGRERELAELRDLVATHRLVTLTGAGGIGKTRLGLEVAGRALSQFVDGAWIVELGSVLEPELVPGAIAREFGIDLGADRDADPLVRVFQRKHSLLVLDNCEHVIDAAARVAELLLHGAPRLSILATSQEPLAAEGERIYRVAPLRVPLGEVGTAAQAIEHSAVQLFVERAQAADPLFALDDHTASAASKICRDVDGIPLAIELAAARVATIGVDALAARLDDRFRLLTGGRRTALRRHQTLRATLDWSYGLLEDTARAILRRIAIFAGSFTLDSAGTVASCDDIDPCRVTEQVADLVRKSLVTFDARASVPRYRLLDTMRAYALEKLAESAELEAIARRHADHYRELLRRAEAGWQTTAAAGLVARHAPEIDNIRAAINWAFGPDGDAEIGVTLAATSIPLWTRLSILGECRDLVGRALSRLDANSSDERRHEMVLQSALAHSSIWAEGSVGVTRSAAERALALAGALGDTDYQMRALYVEWIYRFRMGEYRTCLAAARRFREMAEAEASDAPAMITGMRLEGASWHYLGDHGRARALMERVLGHDDPNLHDAFVARFGLDQRVSALALLARILWLQGFPDQAWLAARAGIAEAKALDHANSLCLALCGGACVVAAMTGDLEATESFTAELIKCAEKHGLGMWRVDGLAFKAWVAMKRSGGEAAIQPLREVLLDGRGTRVESRHTIFVAGLAEALAAAGRVGESLAMVHRALDECSRNDGMWRIPELLRLRGELTLCEGRADAVVAAERDFRSALDLAVRQEARSWQLRAATSLARLRQGQDRLAEAREVLMPIYDWFTEGFATADLKVAKVRLDALGPYERAS